MEIAVGVFFLAIGAGVIFLVVLLVIYKAFKRRKK